MPAVMSGNLFRAGIALIIVIVTTAITWSVADRLRQDHEHDMTHRRERYVASLERELAALHHDLAGMTAATSGKQMAAFLTTKREDFESLSWLGTVTIGRSGQEATEELLGSTAYAGFDPMPALHRLLGQRDLTSGLLAAAVSVHPGGNQSALALAVPVAGAPGRWLVGMVDDRKLFARAFANQQPMPDEISVTLGGALVGYYAQPPSDFTEISLSGAVLPFTIQLGRTELAVNFLPHRRRAFSALRKPEPLAAAAVGFCATFGWLLVSRPGRRPYRNIAVPLAAQTTAMIPARQGLAAQMDGSGLGVAVADGEGWQVREINGDLAAMLGIPVSAALGVPLSRLLGADLPLPPGSTDITPRGPGATARRLRVTLAETAERSILLLAEDISARHQAELRTARLSRLALLGDLAGAFAHEVGQPLNIIRLSAEGSQARLADGGLPDRDRLTRGFSTIVDQTQRAQRMIDELRRFGRRDKTPPAPVAPVPAVRAALRRILPRLKAEGIRLRWHARPATPLVLGHAERLEEAVHRLLVNACDAIATGSLRADSPGPGPGRLEVTCLPCDEGRGVLISIQDSGCGFPAEVLEAMEDEGAGRTGGLGLPIAQGIIAAMGGRMRAANSGPGARVEIVLPATAALPAPSCRPAPPARPQGDGRRHVLVVDDMPDATAEIGAFLAARGWRVSTAGGGNQAWRLFQQDPADAVITDLRMPDGDGWSLIERLRRHSPDLPMVAVTAGQGEEASRAVRAGAAVVLSKPAGLEDIAAELDGLAPSLSPQEES